MRAVAWLGAVATLVASGCYLVVSLNRWEWNRALFFGLLFLMVELALATALILRKLGRLEQRSDPTTARILRETRSAPPDRFRWLEDSISRPNVFITFLVGGGVLLSAAAWVVDRIAARTSTPSGEARLVAGLTPIAYPAGGLFVDDELALVQEIPGSEARQVTKLLHPGQ